MTLIAREPYIMEATTRATPSIVSSELEAKRMFWPSSIPQHSRTRNTAKPGKYFKCRRGPLRVIDASSTYTAPQCASKTTPPLPATSFNSVQSNSIANQHAFSHEKKAPYSAPLLRVPTNLNLIYPGTRATATSGYNLENKEPSSPRLCA
jgi:hypothetical protein